VGEAHGLQRLLPHPANPLGSGLNSAKFRRLLIENGIEFDDQYLL